MKTKLKMIFISILFCSEYSFAMGQRVPTEPSPSPVPNPAPKTNSGVKTLWETNSRSIYSVIVKNVVSASAADLLKGPSDVELFCPMYFRLGTQDRLTFWSQFFASVAKYESGFSPTSRMIESTMGIDPITKKQVASEGLLQLSYQDIQWAPFCEFDWSQDKNYSANDPRKSIFDPEKNLSCGIQILNKQVAKNNKIAISSGAYWAVLKVNGRYSKLNEIKALTKGLSICKP